MSYDSIRIERERSGYRVCVTDPDILKANREADKAKDSNYSWLNPNVEFEFETKAQVLKFVESAMDIALPAEDYSTAFDKFAKQAKGSAE